MKNIKLGVLILLCTLQTTTFAEDGALRLLDQNLKAMQKRQVIQQKQQQVSEQNSVQLEKENHKEVSLITQTK